MGKVIVSTAGYWGAEELDISPQPPQQKGESTVMAVGDNILEKKRYILSPKRGEFITIKKNGKKACLITRQKDDSVRIVFDGFTIIVKS